ncbi:3-deoxy-manno-octulosonate cytidylyltransferase [Sphingomonas sp. ST-64]|uniref:3-deoxy-manno-octulosonate cytidylyltransferase n=1 Tax=Sphingomonas plantiphila TaxID=3163295 RepID=A0ABW8YLI2_9SPHN
MSASSDVDRATAARILIVVPARFGSQRFPGKPLVGIKGPTGAKPLIQWSWEAASTAQDRADILVATDDARIAQVVRGFGGAVAMTDSALRNGTERCAAVLSQLDAAPDLVVNLQGDSPLVAQAQIDALIDAWLETGAPVLTPYLTCDAVIGPALMADHAAGRVGGTTVVSDLAGNALYFSKRPVPFGVADGQGLKLHLGLYAYTPSALHHYASRAPGPLEKAEGLEQLRFLEHGIPIRLVEVERPSSGFWEVNNPEDVPLVEEALAARG